MYVERTLVSSLSFTNLHTYIHTYIHTQDFILACQDHDDGGIADRPGNVADVFHTFFGIAGLSLLGYFDDDAAADDDDDDDDDDPGKLCNKNDDVGGRKSNDDDVGRRRRRRKKEAYSQYRDVDPVYALPVDVVERLGLTSQLLV